MAKNIELPDGRIVEFPDDMQDAAIGVVLRRQFVPPGAEKTGLPGISKPDVQMREAGVLDKAGAVLDSAVVKPVDTFLRSGNRAVSQSIQGVGGATEALGGYLEQTAKEQGKKGIIGGPVKQLGSEIRKFGAGMGRGGEVREDMKGIAGENFLEKPEVAANPEYWVDLAGQISGSMLSMMTPTGAALGQADKAMQLLKIKQQYLPLVKTAIGVSTSSMVETLFDAGNSYQESLQMGASEETARAVVAETFKRELPPTMAFNAFGIFNDMMKGGLKKFALSTLSEGLQESSQGIAQRQSMELARTGTSYEDHVAMVKKDWPGAMVPSREEFERQQRGEYESRVFGPAPFEALVGGMGGAFGEAVMDRVGGGQINDKTGGKSTTNPDNPETTTSDDNDPDGPGGGTPAEKPYTPEQYAQAFELVMKREKAASPTEIRKTLGTDFKTTSAMLQQMQDEGFVKRMGPKGGKFWKIVKRPETQTVETPLINESEQLDPLRANVYEGESQILEFPSEPGSKDASQTAVAQTVQPETLPELQPGTAAETSRQERDPSATPFPDSEAQSNAPEGALATGKDPGRTKPRQTPQSSDLPSQDLAPSRLPQSSAEQRLAAGGDPTSSLESPSLDSGSVKQNLQEIVHEVGDGVELRVTERQDGKFVLKIHDTEANQTLPNERIFNSAEEANEAINAHLTAEGFTPRKDSQAVPIKDGRKSEARAKLDKLKAEREARKFKWPEPQEVSPIPEPEENTRVFTNGDGWVQVRKREDGSFFAKHSTKWTKDIATFETEEQVQEQIRKLLGDNYSEHGADEPKASDKIDGLMKSLETSIAKNESLGDITKFMKRVESESGLSSARGEIEPKQAYDIMEAAVNTIVAQQGREAMKPKADFLKALTGLRAMMKLLPTQSSRSETQVKFQQFSTPPTLAYMAARLAAPSSDDTVLEPSAGTGGLASWAKAAGAKVITNEIDEKRADLLKRQGYEVTRENAEQIHNILPDSVKPTVVLMNPPFSASGVRGTKNTNDVGYRHVEQAFERLEPGGRLVVILGEGATLDASTAQPFWKRMAAKGNIRANIGIDGKEYAKYGTTFGNRTAVIDKTGPTPGTNWLKQRAGIVKGDFKTIEEAWDAVSSIAADRPKPNSAAPAGQASESAGGLRADSVQPESSAGRQPAPGAKRSGTDRGGRTGGDTAPAVLPDQGSGSDRGTQAKPAKLPARKPVVTKPSGELPTVADDAVPPVRPVGKTAPTEAEINAKHGELLKEAADAARERIRKAMQGNQLNSGLDPQLLLDLATMAAQKMHEVGIQFKKWSEPLVQELGEWVREHLQAIRDRAEEVYDSLRAKALQSLSSSDSRQPLDDEERTHTGKKSKSPQEAPTVETRLSEEPLPSSTDNIDQTASPAGKTDPSSVSQAQPTAKGEDDGGNVIYVPSKLPRSWGAKPHPGRIVETQSMAATDEPDILKKPNIPWTLVETGAITEVQLNAVALAAQSHERFAADGTRQGFFIGDGTGVGKGREIAATILHHWNSGVKRMVWVSYKDDLIEDAKRDLTDLGAEIPIMSIKKFKKGQAIEPKFKEGIVFVAYTTLAQSTAPSVLQKDGSKSKDSKAEDFYRVQQLADWAGEETMIVFDEAHKAKNAVVSEGAGLRKAKASSAGRSVSMIQSQLKKARVLYASATGFTDPSNVGYAQRLGLWGEGTAFPTFQAFNSAITNGGVGAMEMLSRDMKAQGKYVSRFLSYAGVDFSEVIHALTEPQVEIFEAAGEAWRTVFKNIEAAMGVTGATSSFAKKNATSQFWSANQRFYRSVLTAMKVPTLFREMDQELESDRSVIISILGTGAAATERALSGMLTDEEGSLDDLDVSPADILKQFVEKSFPILQYEEVLDENENKVSQLVRDSEGNPVVNKEAEAMKNRLLESLDGLKMPEAALDQIINRYGPSNVAELTGRTQRIIEGPDGKRVIEKRKGDGGNSVNVEEARQFQEGKKRIAIISNAASTGISLHADRRAKNQQRRVHIILELKWSADDQMQDFGRSHRTNESSQPVYKLLSVNVGADKRFSSSIARRLEQLGALSRGDRGSSGAGDIAKYNFETKYGEAAVRSVMEHLAKNQRVTLEMMGLAEEGKSVKETVPVTQFLNRLMSLPLETQNKVFDLFMERFQMAIEFAKKEGMFDSGAEQIKADRMELVGEPTVIRTDETTGARTTHYEINAHRKRERVDWEEAKKAIRTDARLMKQKTSGRLIAVKREAYNTQTATDGSIVPIYRFAAAGGEGSINSHELEKFEPIAADSAARDMWDEQFKAAGPFKTEHVHLIGGSVLPIFDKLSEAGRYLKVEIAAMPDKSRILGVRIPATRIKQVLRSLGHGASLTAADVFNGVMEGGETYKLASDIRVKKLTRAGENRIEIVIPSGLIQRVWPLLQKHGGFNENIQYTFRYFVPTNEQGLEALQALMKEFPVMEDSSGKVEMAESKADQAFSFSGEQTGIIDMSAEGLAEPNGVLSVRPTTHPLAPQSARDVAEQAEFITYLPFEDRPAIVGLNTAGLHLMGNALNSNQQFDGVHLNSGAVILAVDNINILAAMQTNPVAVQALLRLKRNLLNALNLNGGLGVVVVLNDNTRTSKQVMDTVREELTHFEQQAFGDARSQLELHELPPMPFLKRAFSLLRQRGYGNLDEAGLLMEAAAQTAAGRGPSLLMTRNQARQFVREYVKALNQKHGKNAARVLRWARQEFQDGPRQKGRYGYGSVVSNTGRPYYVFGRSDSDNRYVGRGEAAQANFARGSAGEHRETAEGVPGRRGESVRSGVGKAQSRSFQDVLDKSEVRRLREKQKRTDTPDDEYRRILNAVSGQTGTKQLTKDQAQQVFDRLSTATVPIGAMLRSPSRILSRSRFGQMIYAAAEESWFLQERLNERWSKNWQKANKGTTKAERNRIALYRFASQIAQMRDEDSAREWLDSIGEDVSIMDDLEGFLTPKEKAVNAKWTKLFFEPSRKMGIEEGLIDGKQQFDNYLSFYHDSTLRMNRKRIKDAAADLAREIGVPIHVAEQILEKANPKKVSFGSFDFTRQEWSIPGLRDADMIAEIYRKGFARKVAIMRFLKEANPLTKKIVDPALRLFARRYIAQYAGKPQSNKVMTDAAWGALMAKIPVLKKYQPSAGELAGWATAAQYNAKIGFNLFTPMLNLTQTVLNTMPYVGTRRTLAVLPRAMAAVALPNKLNPFVRDIARLHRGGIFSDDPGQSKFDRPVFHGVAETVQKAASFLFDKAESLNRATAYLAGLEMAKSEGLSGEDAVRRAREVVRVTQFYSGRLDAPLFSRTPGGKILMQFKTFTIKQLEFVGQLDRKQQAQFALWTVALGGPASLLILQAFKELLPDWEITDWIEQWQENWNIAAWLQAGRLQYQMGVFTIPGLENVGSGRLKDRIGQWLMGPTASTLLDNIDSTGKTLKDPSRFDKWAESIVRGWVPGGVEAIRVRKAMEEAETAEDALKILTGTEKR